MPVIKLGLLPRDTLLAFLLGEKNETWFWFLFWFFSSLLIGKNMSGHLAALFFFFFFKIIIEIGRVLLFRKNVLYCRMPLFREKFIFPDAAQAASHYVVCRIDEACPVGACVLELS